jgi:hypothetical protein
MSNRLTIEYRLVKEEVGKFKRFAAFQTSHGQKNLQPVSIQQWAESLVGPKYHDDHYQPSNKNNKKLIEDLTNCINENTSYYDAYFFETKGATSTNAHTKQFEFVLINAKPLHTFCTTNGPSPDTFAEYLYCLPKEETCCSFMNLGKTSTLISPKYLGEYSHIGKFLRNASKHEIHKLWEKITDEYLHVLRVNPTKSRWLSTSGLGVSWLHFRIDDRPKYYVYQPFAQEK